MASDHHDPVSLRVELYADTTGLTGSVQDESGACQRFSGWLGLLSLLEAARAGTLTNTPGRSSECCTTEAD